MRRDRDWPTRCTLQGCHSPSARPHHHHYRAGHLVTAVCTCPAIAERGTRPFVDPDGRPVR